jgi:hypothetical protein
MEKIMIQKISTTTKKLLSLHHAKQNIQYQSVNKHQESFLNLIHIIIIFDGIDNPVFYSQVLAPQITFHQKTGQPIILISFERSPKKAVNKLNQWLQNYPNITAHTVWRPPFLGTLSITLATHYLKKLLYSVNQNYIIIARGALAGLTALKAHDKNLCKKITIQARGLAAAEYNYTHGSTSWWHRWRTQALVSIEHEAYGNYYSYSSTIPITIEAVSNALGKYLQYHNHTPTEAITIAHGDIPQLIHHNIRELWRKKTRTLLGITHQTIVYCYNGSAKKWQCPAMIIDFFNQEYKKYTLEQTGTTHKPFLLILTQDCSIFEQLLKEKNIPKSYYAIASVSHTDIFQWLCACDIGLLFREPHILNWVSRPTKALEYISAGMSIQHNNTIAWLIEDH